ncbi:hypothetical protein M0R45_037995 [Rubus argutus]|uniref:Uncharacterized protein n=1 Tax=Rubus argutus TaxID=59490 RepID=A0AAW1W3P8_RUBAR
MNNNQHMASRGALSGSAQAALALTNYQNLLMRQNSMNSNANSLQQEASSSFNNSNQSPLTPFQATSDTAATAALTSVSNSLLQQTNPQKLPRQSGLAATYDPATAAGRCPITVGEGSTTISPGPNSNGTLTRNGLSFGGNNSGAAPATSNVSGSHGPAPSRSNSSKLLQTVTLQQA